MRWDQFCDVVFRTDPARKPKFFSQELLLLIEDYFELFRKIFVTHLVGIGKPKLEQKRFLLKTFDFPSKV